MHVPRHLGPPDDSKLPPFNRQVARFFRDRGGVVEVHRRVLDDLAGLDDPDVFHLVHNGRISHHRLLNTGLAYLDGYWYADPKGIFCDSTLADAAFVPETIQARAAAGFFRRLQEQLVTARRSRYGQPVERAMLPHGAIALFLQGWSDPVARARHIGAVEMVRTVLAHRQGLPLVVKPHPRNPDGETRRVLALLADHPDVVVSDANVHDILASAAVTVSICSAVSLEGMLHRAPAVLFGRADFHHVAETVLRPGDWPAALARALSVPRAYDRYLYWFLHQGMIGLKRADKFDRLLARIAAKGFDPARFGLDETVRVMGGSDQG